jgi:hypothetical protein
MRYLIAFATTIFMMSAAASVKIDEAEKPEAPGKEVQLIYCFDPYGNLVSYGNTCVNGYGNCIPKSCPRF